MKRIQIDDDVQQFLPSHSMELGESASSILRRELHLPLPPGSVDTDHLTGGQFWIEVRPQP